MSVPFVYSCNNKTDSTVPPELEVVTNPMGPEEKSQFLHVQASGDWSITIEYPEDQPAEWASVKPSTGTGNKSVTLKVEYYAGVQARKACIVLTAGSKKAELVLTQNGRSGGGGNLNPSTGWMELPAMPKDSKYDFFSHDMKIGNVTTRNYTYAWDYANLVAPWVAYPLCKWNIGDNIIVKIEMIHGLWIHIFRKNSSLCCICEVSGVLHPDATIEVISCRQQIDYMIIVRMTRLSMVPI